MTFMWKSSNDSVVTCLFQSMFIFHPPGGVLGSDVWADDRSVADDPGFYIPRASLRRRGHATNHNASPLHVLRHVVVFPDGHHYDHSQLCHSATYQGTGKYMIELKQNKPKQICKRRKKKN